MKISLYNLFIYILKIVGVIFALSYLFCLSFVWRQRNADGRSITLSIFSDALFFMIWIILLLLSGLSINEIFYGNKM